MRTTVIVAPIGKVHLAAEEDKETARWREHWNRQFEGGAAFPKINGRAIDEILSRQPHEKHH